MIFLVGIIASYKRIISHFHSLGSAEQLLFTLIESQELLVSNVISRRSSGNHSVISHTVILEHNSNKEVVAHIIKKYYNPSVVQDDLISIGTIGLIKGISSYRADKNVRLATYAARCIENEILMFFRSQKKLQGEVSLSDTLETDKEGNSLFLMDIVGVADTMLEDLEERESQIRVRALVEECLSEREADIIRRRYGLDGNQPRTQRELAAAYGISRSYVSRRGYGKLGAIGVDFSCGSV